MALDGFSLPSLGVLNNITPAEIHMQAQQASINHQNNKKVEQTEQYKLNPDRENRKQEQNQKKKSQDEAYADIFDELPEERKSDIEDLSKALNLTENKRDYQVVYNSVQEIVEIIHIKSGVVTETLTLEELKSFIMKVKNPLGIIVDRKV